MSAWTIVFCFLIEVRGDLLPMDQEKALCIFNAIRREYFDCFPSKDVPSTQLKWNSILEYYASVYARQLCMNDLNIPIRMDFTEYKDLTSAWSRLDVFDQ
ncbi:hypothetical protein PHET_11128 [Paragonimus heterotremus]|uniref:Uncharacterized protein n=1 Tax=Paragonimus heterotremus TaxID=100268 RepID=A0A8J4SG17_9TREM|nr:hypothetical protein PHET_11128 [Paragonimus heterotremus]